MVNEIMKKAIAPIIAEAYAEGYKKCLTDVVQRSNFIYEVIAEKARQDVLEDFGAIEIPEVDEELEREVFHA